MNETYQVVIEHADGWREKLFDYESQAWSYYRDATTNQVALTVELRKLSDSDQVDQYGGTIHRVEVLAISKT